MITCEELKEKLDRSDDFKLVMALGDWHFRAAHIPGSIAVCSPAEIAELLDPDDEIRALVEKRELGFMRNLGGGEFKGRPPCIYRCQVSHYSDSEDLGILRGALRECKNPEHEEDG